MKENHSPACCQALAVRQKAIGLGQPGAKAVPGCTGATKLLEHFGGTGVPGKLA
jgi:hypothetical protein